MGSYEDALKSATDTSQNKNILFRFSKTYPAWVILIFTLGLSFVLWKFIGNQVDSDNQENFDKATSSVVVRLEEKYKSESQVLNSLKPIFNGYVVRDAFELNAKPPASADSVIRSIMKITEVDSNEYGNFVYNTRSQGYYDIRIHPKAKRDKFYITEYVVPFENNKDRSGYDFASEPKMVELFKEAGMTGETKLSSIYNVRPDTLGFYFLSPVYKAYQRIESDDDRKAYWEGVLAIEIKVPDFFKSAIGDGIATDSTIIFNIIDNNSPLENKSFYKSTNYSLLETDFVPLLSKKEVLNIGDHEIEIEFYTVPNFGGFQNYLPILSIITGIIVSLALFAFVISVITSRQRALELADQMTRSQRRIVESSQDIIAVLDFNGEWKSMNQACEDIFNQGADEMIGTQIDSLFEFNSDTQKFYKIIETGLEDITERIDLRMLARGNKKKWINWSFTVSQQDSLVYAIGRDITLQKEVEAQQKIRNKQVQLAERFSREASESKSYFMTTLSHQLRNSLTGILGYISLIQDGIYESKEEMLNYLQMAEESGENIFTFISDYLDMTAATDKGLITIDISTVKLKETFDNVKFKMTSLDSTGEVNLEYIEETPGAKFQGDRNLINETLLTIFQTFSTKNSSTNITIQVTENTYEKATEVQILASENAIVEEMIGVYKNSKSDILEALVDDKEDVLLNLATIESNVRRLNGSVQFETFGGEEGNVVIMTLPISAIKI